MPECWRSIGEDDGTHAVLSELLKSLFGGDAKENYNMLLCKVQDQERHGLANGSCGLALLAGYLDEIQPAQGWDRLAHSYLQIAVEGVENMTHTNKFGLFSGLTGIAFVATYLSKNFTRYTKLLDALDAKILSHSTRMSEYIEKQENGMPTSAFDLIEGAIGVGAYLLFTKKEAENATLKTLLTALVSKATDCEGLLKYSTPRNLQVGWKNDYYAHGGLDCGIAHGITGLLSFLSLAKINDVIVEGQTDAIRTVAEFLLDNKMKDTGGVEWPGVVPLKLAESKELESCCIEDGSGNILHLSKIQMQADVNDMWCYGNSGVARAMFLAGEAINNRKYVDSAISSMSAVYDRALGANGTNSIFCHGTAGLLQVTLRFLNDTDLEMFDVGARELRRQLLTQHDPSTLLGYKNRVDGGKQEDNCGVLEGTAGIALALLASSSNVDPKWDRIFLLG